MKNNQENAKEKMVGENDVWDINNSLKDKIYTIRGVPVMLDYDLADIYGYTTSAFNQQVARNIEKFEGEEFMFQLTKHDIEGLSMRENRTSISKNLISISQNVISIQTKGMKGGRAKMPYAFTEQGIYMLMTVLRGKLAVKQSRSLIMMFKAMKDYIIENQAALEYRDSLKIIAQVAEHAKDISEAKHKINEMETEVKAISRKMNDVITRSDISPIILDFANRPERHEFLFLNGELTKANEAYQNIYSKARRSIHIVDNYISLKTLRHLSAVKPGVEIIIFSDNNNKYLCKSDLRDFKKDFPSINLKLIKTDRKIHDRFIVLDYGAKQEKVFHCGASSKDAGNKLTAISEFTESGTRQVLNDIIENMLANPELQL